MTDHAAPLAPSKPRVDSQWTWGTGVAYLKLASLSVEDACKRTSTSDSTDDVGRFHLYSDKLMTAYYNYFDCNLYESAVFKAANNTCTVAQ